jgi:hypothetical protein
MAIGMLAAFGASGVSSAYNAYQQRKHKAKISPQELASLERKEKDSQSLSKMFQDRAANPLGSVMPFAEQQYYDQRRDSIYDEGRQRQQQGLMGAMNRTGALASGATNYNLQRFGQETLRDKQQFYFQDQQNRLNQNEQAIQSTFNMGLGVMGTPVQGTQYTDLGNARTRQKLAYKTQWSNQMGSMANSYMGAGFGGMAAGG